MTYLGVRALRHEVIKEFLRRRATACLHEPHYPYGRERICYYTSRVHMLFFFRYLEGASKLTLKTRDVVVSLIYKVFKGDK